ncbi:MAG: histidinol phosphatase [Ruminococcus sp.]|nr:histidinol phosphatase [Ruminococcus sp.]MBQ3936977.1 histidinol phosphatase [Ruminococcus sp.]
MEYIYETHCHTSQGSACGRMTGEELARFYKDAGYDGVIVTDHFFNGNCAVDPSLPWKKKCELYCAGYCAAKRVGDKIGLTVMFGIEYSYFGTDLLIYGLDEEWLKAHPEIMDMYVKDFMRFVYENGGLIVHAHPFRKASYIDTIRLFPYDVDAVEVYNAGNDPKADERANWYADSYGLVKVAGSDRHGVYSEERCAVVFDEKLESIEDYMRLVRADKIKRLICER